ncbi:MAG: tRNA 2-selenouridine synthase [Campylobacter sp.]|nr:tRNA 2-selenouridine synthase [Campylobacter sp.]
MKSISLIFILLLGVFLVSCTAKGINTKELEKLAEQYGGVYVFDKKLEKEIDQRELDRENFSNELGDKIRTRIGKHTFAINMEPVDKKFPQTLSNGKKYYTHWTKYDKVAKVPQNYLNKIINYIGLENCKKKGPHITLGKFYVDDNKIIPISILVTYTYTQKQYGLFGDEGQGFSFSKDETIYASGGHSFYYNGKTFIKESK